MKTKFFFVLAMLGVATLASANEEPVVLSTDGTYSISYDANGNAVGMAAPEHKLGESGLFGRRSDVSLRESAARELRNIRSSIRRTLHFNSMVNDESVASALSDEFSQSASRAGKTVREASANLDRNINAEEAALNKDGGVVVVSKEALVNILSGGPSRAAGNGGSFEGNIAQDFDWDNLLHDNLEFTADGDGNYTLTYDDVEKLFTYLSGISNGDYISAWFSGADEFFAHFGFEYGRDNGGTATLDSDGNITPNSGARCPVGEPIVLGLMAAGYAALRRRKNEE